MANTYDLNEYLLDRADIQDVIELLYIYFDTGDYEKMRSDVFADNVTVDFTEMWGGDPFTVTGAALTDQWKASFQSKAAGAQHVVTSVVPMLPRPGEDDRPSTAKAVSNGSALIRSFKNNLVQQAGRLYVDLARTEVGDRSANPWRILGLTAHVVWQNDVPPHQLATDYDDYFSGGKSDNR